MPSPVWSIVAATTMCAQEKEGSPLRTVCGGRGRRGARGGCRTGCPGLARSQAALACRRSRPGTPATAPSKASGAAACVTHNTHAYATHSMEYYYSSDNVKQGTGSRASPAQACRRSTQARGDCRAQRRSLAGLDPAKPPSKSSTAHQRHTTAFSDQRYPSSPSAKPFAAAKRLVS